MNSWIGISLGDVTGIGPEVTLKALAAEPADDTRYLLLGDRGCLHRINDTLGLRLPLTDFKGYDLPGRFQICDAGVTALSPDLRQASPTAADAAMVWLREGAMRCLRLELDALVTAPVNKESIIRAGHSFVGQTEFLSELAGTRRTAMMLLGHDEQNRWLRVTLATTHLPLRHVADHLTQEKIVESIELTAQALRELGLERGRIAVCGLNPHAGEGGVIGDEEITTIAPAVSTASKLGIQVEGPLSGDIVFYHAFRGEFDAVVAMYHDQGLGPLKLIGFETGINWTVGLPFIRTSPDHGTAYNLTGRGVANPSSMQSALSLAKQLVRRRKVA